VGATLACSISTWPDSASAAALTASVQGPVSPADAAATRAYLEADYQLARATLSNVAALKAAEEAFAEGLGRECHGVLSGEPKEEEIVLGFLRTPPETARSRGEHKRSELQATTIDAELAFAFIRASDQPNEGAVEAFAAKVGRLSWSNPDIALAAQSHAATLEERAASSPTSVCADMRTWAQSGYHVLSSNSREFQAARTARAKTAVPSAPIASLLKPYEDAGDRRLVHQTEAVESRIAASSGRPSGVFARLRRDLGVPESRLEAKSRGSALGHRSTQAGSTVTVRRETSPESFGAPCKHSVSVEFSERSKGSEQSSGGYSSSMCIGGRQERQPSASCGSGVESITAVVPASVRAVRMTFNDGQTVTARVFRIPRSAGGPAGLFAEAIRGYARYPVSLTELNDEGTIVAVEKVGFHCMRERRNIGPSFVELAQGATPEGEPFTIEGVVFIPSRGPASFNLMLGIGIANRGGEAGAHTSKPKAFSWSLALECPPHEFAVIYGTLSTPGSSVLARTSSGLVPLTKVQLAPDLHSGGPLVYGVFQTLPSELVVLGGDGSTLYSESLVARATEEREYCEGYAEA
jgi:hypothetical protein